MPPGVARWLAAHVAYPPLRLLLVADRAAVDELADRIEVGRRGGGEKFLHESLSGGRRGELLVRAREYPVILD